MSTDGLPGAGYGLVCARCGEVIAAGDGLAYVTSDDHPRPHHAACGDAALADGGAP